jgi:hypothetical protein
VDQTVEGGVPVFVQTIQNVDKGGGFTKNETFIQKYVCDKGRIKIIAEHRDNSAEGHKTTTELHYSDPAYAMLEPTALKSGTTWSYSFTPTYSGPDITPAKQPSITASCTAHGEEEVTVPAGKLKAIKVTKKIGKSEITEYYARGMGLIKRVSGDGATWELMSYSGLKAGG